jgi:large conductance mechanosensitive channel
MSIAAEFKKFAMRGNVIDLAVGVVIGAAFGKIVSSLVADVVMPPLGLLIGGINFSDMGITLKQAVGETPAVVLAYGKFLQNIFDFLIVAAAIFALVKLINSLKHAEPPPAQTTPPPETPADIKLLAEIRDLLKAQQGASPPQ